jgi:N-acetylmuramate 1-kinase
MNRNRIIHNVLKHYWGDNRFSLTKLTGDAGTRVYYRSTYGEQSVVLMDRQEPYDSRTDPFFRLTRYLSSHNFPVPEILKDLSSDGILLLHDLGDQTLQNEYCQNACKTLDTYYPQVFNQLIRLHTVCRKETAGEYSDVFSLRFDYAKLRGELDFFLNHFVRKFKNILLDREQTTVLDTHFEQMCRILEKEPAVFTHRDLHSRNIMITDGAIFLIDYQDARTGPPEYDLASILRDAYVKLPEDYIEDFLQNYYRETADIRNAVRRRYMFSLMCIQRNIKALGTFGFQAHVRKNFNYVKYIPLLKYHISTELHYLDGMRGDDRVFPMDGQSFRRVLLDEVFI